MAQILQTLDRGIRVLKYLAAVDEPKTVAEVAASLDLERTAAFRCLTTLAAQDLVTQDADSKWRVDPRAALLAPPRIPLLAAEATPILQQLANTIGLTTCLTIAHGDMCMALKVCEPPGANFHIAYREGSTHPCDVGAAGLAILASEPPQPGERPVLQKIRDQTYASSTGELQANAYGYSVAIKSATIRASVGLISLDPLEESGFLQALTDTARELGELGSLAGGA
ncbi:MAG: IclR family transcriptional regulator [Acidimicrobiales bacterium]